LQHYKTVANFREAVKAHGVEKGSFAADADTRSPRLAPAERKAELLTEAYSQAQQHGLKAVTRPSVAGALDVSDGLVTRYFGNLQGLRDAVLAQAVVLNEPDIIADAIELDMNVHHVPPDLVDQARNILAA
jgi:AcrR family transcriptional regulator